MYDQLSLLGSQAATSAPEATSQPVTPAGVTYYPIDEATARRGHEMMSMRDYIPNSATDGYKAAVNEAATLVADKRKHTSSFYHGKLDAYLDSYAKRLAQWTNDYNRNKASCPSILISGGSNFPTKKKAKQNAREDRLWEEYKGIQAILDKIKAIGTGPVDLADPHAREILTDQLQKLQKKLEDDKALNVYYRKHKSFEGFPGISPETAAKLSTDFADTQQRCPWIDKPIPDYELTSLRGKIKRVQARIAELDKLQKVQTEPDPATDYDGFQLIRNAAENRLQIIFDEIPDPDMREKLKSNGFRWSPRNKAWQRRLTDNAERAARSILGIE